MGRSYHSASDKAVDYATAVDKMVAEIDPQMLLCAGLGAIAARGGIIPPFTRFLSMFATSTGSNPLDLQQDYTKLYTGVLVTAISPAIGLTGFIMSLFSTPSPTKEDGTEKTEKEKEDEKLTQALMASGAMEAMLMYMIMRQPELMSTVIKQPAEIMKGIGEIVPG